MKIATILLTTLMLAFAFPAYAKPDRADTATATKETALSGDVLVKVNGLVCDFCARALEKIFGKQEEVKDIDVNLDEKIITIDFVDGKSLDDEIIAKLIIDSGYNVESIQHVE